MVSACRTTRSPAPKNDTLPVLWWPLAACGPDGAAGRGVPLVCGFGHRQTYRHRLVRGLFLFFWFCGPVGLDGAGARGGGSGTAAGHGAAVRHHAAACGIAVAGADYSVLLFSRLCRMDRAPRRLPLHGCAGVDESGCVAAEKCCDYSAAAVTAARRHVLLGGTLVCVAAAGGGADGRRVCGVGARQLDVWQGRGGLQCRTARQPLGQRCTVA